MWRDIWARIKGAVRKVLRIGEVESKAGVKTIVDSEMAKAVELWGLMFEDRAPWLDEETESLNLAAGITSELARLKALADGGYLKPEKLIAWYFGVSEEEAAGYIPPKDTAGLFDGLGFNK